MFIDTYDLPDFVEEHMQGVPRHKKHHPVCMALIFMVAYFTTITVHAQQDAIQLGQNEAASVTGTVKDADENWLVITTAGKDMRIDLDDVDLKAEADTLFTPGMTVSIDGRLNGEDFGMPVLEAKSITATSPNEARGGILANQR